MQLPLPAIDAPAAAPDAPTAANDAPAPPVRYSKLAIVSGYLGIVPFAWAFFLFPYAYSKFPAWMGWKWIGITCALTVGIGMLPALITAILGHRRIRRDPGRQGMSHVWFAYVACFMVFGVLVTALILQVVRK
ncbi:MAG: hypothetical protein HY898_06025 [Deltaproteobacteria bacterium]|nr:hypothetical protein [Deltaproteobacteria bacterium]